ncbi:hypothetical protein JTB14_029029 [Gonioctena quinquepunctata]|nr:hypothetical protein JTB14_029029 [Gonioctena quinquepunctata]
MKPMVKDIPLSPALSEVLIGRKVRTALDLLLPSQEGVHRNNNNHVYYQVHGNNGYQWKPGEITSKIGNVVYELSLKNSQRILRAHANQPKKGYIGFSEIENDPLPLDILMKSFEISRNPRGNIPLTSPAEQIDIIPSTPSAEQIDVPTNLFAELILPDHIIHGSQQKKTIYRASM